MALGEFSAASVRWTCRERGWRAKEEREKERKEGGERVEEEGRVERCVQGVRSEVRGLREEW